VSRPSVSIVINTLNRAPFLDDALSSLTGLNYDNFEVIVVNGPSTDSTEKVLEAWKDRVKLKSCDVPNLSVSRNVGIAASDGEIVCFMDDDAAPHPDWLRHLVRHYALPEIGGVGGFTVDNTGVRWQVCKTVCDRFGDAFSVSQFFDERPLNRPGSPLYPSLLGTNSSFRARALREIGGFNDVFAYFLDETDVCIRMVDAGWHIVYEPSALIFHQFAPSDLRSRYRIAKTYLPSATSKSYFIHTHAARASVKAAAERVDSYKVDILSSNKWFFDNGEISAEHRFNLDADLLEGIERGTDFARRDRGVSRGSLGKHAIEPFRAFEASEGFRIALISQGYPPSTEAGIARWTHLTASGLAKLGAKVHVITMASGSEESVVFKDGVWVHRLAPVAGGQDSLSAAYRLPPNIGAWCERVLREIQYLKSFGLQAASFPIWDVEGLPLLDDPDILTIMSLHTTYALAKPFKPEWNARPLFEHHMVNKMITAEHGALVRAPHILANSQAILRSIADTYGVDVSDRAVIIPHGTDDAIETRRERWDLRNREIIDGSPMRVLFVGRFEPRKGFDIALDVATALIDQAGVSMSFIGDNLSDQALEGMDPKFRQAIADGKLLRFLGTVSRSGLDDAYVDHDVLVAPSRFESFGLIAIEAMAAGRPVISLDIGGLGEVATESNGCMQVDASGADVAGDIVRHILRLRDDRKELLARAEMARAAFERAYSADEMARAIQGFVNDRLTALNPRNRKLADVM